jgi:hypothetical protein
MEAAMDQKRRKAILQTVTPYRAERTRDHAIRRRKIAETNAENNPSEAARRLVQKALAKEAFWQAAAAEKRASNRLRDLG